MTTGRAPRPVPHSELASAVGPSAHRRDEDAGPSEASASPAMGLTEPAFPPAADVELIAGDANREPNREAGR